VQADAFPTSNLNSQPQFLTYQHNILVMSGFNEEYHAIYGTTDAALEALELLADATPKGGILIYNQTVELLSKIAAKNRPDIKILAYQTPPYAVKSGQAYLSTTYGTIPIAYLEERVIQAIGAAQILASNLGIDEKRFHEAIPSLILAYNTIP
jgi:UDP-N-acetylmuramate: L-alanyl-gamma-D-glutamyl-meso-diaminopimelate ligase